VGRASCKRPDAAILAVGAFAAQSAALCPLPT
jgi:hypothetical protein